MEIIQTDNAGIYSGTAFKKALAKAGIQHSHPAPSKPAANGRVETFFRQMRDEFFKQWHDGGDTPMSLTDFEKELKKFVDNRNSGLPGGSTPASD